MKNKYLKNALNNIRRERLLSITNVIIMGMTFLVLGIFIYVIAVTHTILKTLEQQAQVTIFFKDEFPEGNILDLQNKLSTDKRILAVNYVSKEDAYSIFKEINKDDPTLLESVTSSILPASLEIRAKSLNDLPKLAEEFKTLDGIEEVRIFEDVIGRFKKFSTVVYGVGIALVVMFFVISYSVVLATLRSTIHSKGTELEILKLVGAKNAYVKKPILYQGIIYGLTSSLLAGLVLMVLIQVLNLFHLTTGGITITFFFWHSKPVFVNIGTFLFSFLLWILLVISGVLLGYFGSLLAVRRYLKY